jgi:NDP-sugar pyrophosphorylase family protein
MSKTFVIILAAGLATRLKPLSNRIPKPLIEINCEPIISRTISAFKEAGFTQFCVLIGYKGELVRKEIQKIQDIEIEFVLQNDLTGMADAISLCVNHINSKYENISNFFISAADILFSKEMISQMFKLFQNSNIHILLSLMRSKDIGIAKGHGNVKISNDSESMKDLDIHKGLTIIDIIEKPKSSQILSDYYSLPLYLFNRSIINHLSDVKISERGEREFQDVIKKAILEGKEVRGISIIQENITVENIGKYHLTNLEDILRMNFRFIKGIKTEEPFEDYPTLIEPVRLNRGLKIGDNVLIGPNVIVGRDCEIEDNCELVNTIMFDHVVLGNNVKLNSCIIEESIFLPNNIQAKNCFITHTDKEKREIKLIKF